METAVIGFVVGWAGFAVVAALAAAARGRDPVGWLALGALFGAFALMAVLVMRPVTPAPPLAARRGAVLAALPQELGTRRPNPEPGSLAEVYGGRQILHADHGRFGVGDMQFAYLVDAKRYIDQQNGRYD